MVDEDVDGIDISTNCDDTDGDSRKESGIVTVFSLAFLSFDLNEEDGIDIWPNSYGSDWDGWKKFVNFLSS